jgi:hypothetical protein
MRSVTRLLVSSDGSGKAAAQCSWLISRADEASSASRAVEASSALIAFLSVLVSLG